MAIAAWPDSKNLGGKVVADSGTYGCPRIGRGIHTNVIHISCRFVALKGPYGFDEAFQLNPRKSSSMLSLSKTARNSLSKSW